CRRVVMVIGNMRHDSDGLAWEVQRIFEINAPEKVALVMPPVRQDEARERWQKLREASGHKLPAYEGGELIVTFSTEWKCHVHRGKDWYVGKNPRKADYRWALELAIRSYKWEDIAWS